MYAREITEASKSALLEIGLVLKRYRTDMVLSGGWAPYFITNGYFEHCGSIDIDLVLRTKIMKKYETIKKSILELGYIEEDPFRFSRTVKSPIDGKDYGVYLDFLCDKEGMKHVDLKNVQEDLQAFSFEGLNIAFEFNFEQEIAAILPNNGEAKTQFRVIDLVGSLALKGQALDGRTKPKDSYDIYALVHYGGGPEKAAEYFNITVSKKKTPTETKKLLVHSVSVVREQFKNANQMGPFQVENFSDGKFKRNIVAIKVNQFLKLIKI